MTSRPTVSVIIPTYNRAQFLLQALRSVLAQTFSNLEAIVVDDGSTDETEQVVSEIKDPRIRYVRQPHYGLPAVSRNRGIDLAQGKFVAFLDSDDLWLPNKLGIQISYMEDHPRVGFTFTNAEGFRGVDDKWRLVKFGLNPKKTLKDLLCQNFIATLTVVLRHDCLKGVGGFNEDPQLRALEDYQLWVRIAASYPFVYLSNITARYRIHESNLADETLVTIERTIAMLRGLKGETGVPETHLRRGLAAHYRRLARAHALAGNNEEYAKALISSWKSCPDWKTGALLFFYRLTGFGASRWMTATARHLKATFDQGLWRLQSNALGARSKAHSA